MHKEGLFWQNRAYAAGRSTLPTFETALPGAVCSGGAAAVGVIGPGWVGEPVVSSHGKKATAAKTASAAATRGGPPGGGLLNISISVVVDPLAVMITPWACGGDSKSVAVDGFNGPTIR
jgi:hypothetical protein